MAKELKDLKKQEFKHLKEQDLNDGEEIQYLYNGLGEEEKKIARIYLSALSDRCNFVNGKIA